MTDHPRFQVARSRPEDCHRQHHGASLVEWSFRAADWWLERQATSTTGRPVSFSFNLAGGTHHDARQR